MYCGKCGNALPAESAFCPKCGTSVGSSLEPATVTGVPWYYSTWLIVLTSIFFAPIGIALMWLGKRFSLGARIATSAVAALWFLFVISADHDSKPTTPLPAGSLPSSSGATTEYKVGQTFRLGNFSYRVDRVTQQPFIGNEFVSEQSGPEATFFLVFYTIRNDGAESKTVMTTDFKVIDAKGRTFEPDSSATTAYMMSGGNVDFLVSELHPGISKSTIQIFRVPTEVLKSKLALEIPHTRRR